MANEEIKKAYRTLGREANFYDGMITCSTVPGKAVCKLARTDWFIHRFYEPKSFITPPFEYPDKSFGFSSAHLSRHKRAGLPCWKAHEQFYDHKLAVSNYARMEEL